MKKYILGLILGIFSCFSMATDIGPSIKSDEGETVETAAYLSDLKNYVSHNEFPTLFTENVDQHLLVNHHELELYFKEQIMNLLTGGDGGWHTDYNLVSWKFMIETLLQCIDGKSFPGLGNINLVDNTELNQSLRQIRREIEEAACHCDFDTNETHHVHYITNDVTTVNYITNLFENVYETFTTNQVFNEYFTTNFVNTYTTNNVVTEHSVTNFIDTFATNTVYNEHYTTNVVETFYNTTNFVDNYTTNNVFQEYYITNFVDTYTTNTIYNDYVTTNTVQTYTTNNIVEDITTTNYITNDIVEEVTINNYITNTTYNTVYTTNDVTENITTYNYITNDIVDEITTYNYITNELTNVYYITNVFENVYETFETNNLVTVNSITNDVYENTYVTNQVFNEYFTTNFVETFTTNTVTTENFITNQVFDEYYTTNFTETYTTNYHYDGHIVDADLYPCQCDPNAISNLQSQIDGIVSCQCEGGGGCSCDLSSIHEEMNDLDYRVDSNESNITSLSYWVNNLEQQLGGITSCECDPQAISDLQQAVSDLQSDLNNLDIPDPCGCDTNAMAGVMENWDDVTNACSQVPDLEERVSDMENYNLSGMSEKISRLEDNAQNLDTSIGDLYSKLLDVDDTLYDITNNYQSCTCNSSAVAPRAANESIAPEFSTEVSYEVGDVVFYEGKLYESTKEVPANKPFNADSWKPTSVAAMLKEMRMIRKLVEGSK